jgi:hypothetical protein
MRAPTCRIHPRARSLRVLLAAALAAATLGAVAPAAHAVPCAQRGDVTIPVRTFHLEAKWAKKSYRIGQTAELEVTVTRPSHQDPVTDEGHDLPVGPPTSVPAEEVTVGVGLYLGDVFLSGGGVTDAEGHMVAKIKIQNYAKPGQAASTVYAYKKYLTDTRCVYLQEFAYVRMPEAFKVTR